MFARDLVALVNVYLGKEPGHDANFLLANRLAYKTNLSPNSNGHYVVTEKGERLVSNLLDTANQMAQAE